MAKGRWICSEVATGNVVDGFDGSISAGLTWNGQISFAYEYLTKGWIGWHGVFYGSDIGGGRYRGRWTEANPKLNKTAWLGGATLRVIEAGTLVQFFGDWDGLPANARRGQKKFKGLWAGEFTR